MKLSLRIGIVLMSALGFSLSAQAGTDRASGKTQCYVFKNDKLHKKGVCSFESYNSSNVFQSTDSMDFVVPNYGKIGYVRSATVDDTASGDKYVAKTLVIEVNEKPATFQIRDVKNYKVLAIEKIPENLTSKYIECYKQKQTNLEICYDPKFISSKYHN